jgi:hypothetical protein
MPSEDQTKGSFSSDRAPSSFRTMMEALREVKGDTPQWPVILRAFLQAECLRQQPQLTPYTSTVAISRHDKSAEGVTVPEKKAVRELYNTCVKDHQSVFRIGNEEYLLLGWEWPNQASESRMAADLVALNRNGGLVVFEAKMAKNHDTPFTAALEGLDYLVHLTLHQNFRQIINAVAKWKAEGRLNPPVHFQGVQPSLSSRHEVIVLAPDDYYETYSDSKRGHGWKEFRKLEPDESAFVDIRFGKADFSTNTGAWA